MIAASTISAIRLPRLRLRGETAPGGDEGSIECPVTRSRSSYRRSLARGRLPYRCRECKAVAAPRPLVRRRSPDFGSRAPGSMPGMPGTNCKESLQRRRAFFRRRRARVAAIDDVGRLRRTRAARRRQLDRSDLRERMARARPRVDTAFERPNPPVALCKQDLCAATRGCLVRARAIHDDVAIAREVVASGEGIEVEQR